MGKERGEQAKKGTRIDLLERCSQLGRWLQESERKETLFPFAPSAVFDVPSHRNFKDVHKPVLVVKTPVSLFKRFDREVNRHQGVHESVEENCRRCNGVRSFNILHMNDRKHVCSTVLCFVMVVMVVVLDFNFFHFQIHFSYCSFPSIVFLQWHSFRNVLNFFHFGSRKRTSHLYRKREEALFPTIVSIFHPL